MSGKFITLHIRGLACPRGWHPAKDGMVTIGPVSRGFPCLLRLWAWVLVGRSMSCLRFVTAFPGCGCIHVLKAWCEKRGWNVPPLCELVARQIDRARALWQRVLLRFAPSGEAP